ncbi:MAG TPA: hypothetical protein VGD71_21670 [Kribbella sp.]
MKRFVVPPSWPTPPGRHWVPPRTWRPDATWPPAPADWKFWVDGKGKPVTGPVGLYGAPSRRKLVAGVSGAVFLIAVNFWALTAIGLFDGHQSSHQAFPVVDESPSPSATPTAVKSSTPPALVKKTTALPTVTPTNPRTTPKPSPTERSEPTPKKTKTSKTRPVPSKPTPTQTLTQEQILAAYCRQRGVDPGWCDPSNWRTP